MGMVGTILFLQICTKTLKIMAHPHRKPVWVETGRGTNSIRRSHCLKKSSQNSERERMSNLKLCQKRWMGILTPSQSVCAIHGMYSASASIIGPVNVLLLIPHCALTRHPPA